MSSVSEVIVHAFIAAFRLGAAIYGLVLLAVNIRSLFEGEAITWAVAFTASFHLGFFACLWLLAYVFETLERTVFPPTVVVDGKQVEKP